MNWNQLNHTERFVFAVAILSLLSCSDNGTEVDETSVSSSVNHISSVTTPVSSGIQELSSTEFSSAGTSSSESIPVSSGTSSMDLSSGGISVPYSSSSMVLGSSTSTPVIGARTGSMIFTPANLWVDTTETTQALYFSVMSESPSYFNRTGCPNCPVENITAFEAMLYANKRTKSELGSMDTVYQYTSVITGTPGNVSAQTKTSEVQNLVGLTIRPGAKGFRLPTEDEWKILQKGTSTLSGVYWKALYPGDYASAQANAGLYAWYGENASGTPQSVAQKIPNGFGLYDICGNVEEYTQTFYQGSYVSKGVAADATLGALMLVMAAQAEWLTGVRLVRDP